MHPDAIGFRLDTYWFHRVVEWATYFKAYMDVRILVGGINVTLYPEETFSYPCFDYGIMGEALVSLPRLISALEKSSIESDISGVIYRKNNKIIINPPNSGSLDFDDYPHPARHMLPNHLYYSFTSQRKNFTIIVTSTGCPFKCSFCAISRLPYRERSSLSVVDEIEECHKRHKVREIDFFDATFFINKKRVIEICEGVLKKGIKIEWSCRSRVDIVDEDILKIARKAGCKKIYYGIESASEDVLDHINKGINRMKVEQAIELSRKHGIKTLGFFMVGNPADTKESILSSIDFAKKLKLDFIQVCRTIPKPNTELNDSMIQVCGSDYWREYILAKRGEGRFPAPWTNLSDTDIEWYIKKFYKCFYFRPAYIFRRILETRSINELIRYIKVGWKWIFCNFSDIKT